MREESGSAMVCCLLASNEESESKKIRKYEREREGEGQIHIPDVI